MEQFFLHPACRQSSLYKAWMVERCPFRPCAWLAPACPPTASNLTLPCIHSTPSSLVLFVPPISQALAHTRALNAIYPTFPQVLGFHPLISIQSEFLSHDAYLLSLWQLSSCASSFSVALFMIRFSSRPESMRKARSCLLHRCILSAPAWQEMLAREYLLGACVGGEQTCILEYLFAHLSHLSGGAVLGLKVSIGSY